MILHVNFRYGAKVFGKRKRNPDDRSYLGVVPVDIREVTSDEAPVALRFKTDQFYDEAPSQVLNLRWVDGKLWRPAFEVSLEGRREGTQTVTPRGADWVTRCAERGFLSTERSHNVLPVGTAGYNQPEPKPFEQDADVSRVQSTDKDERAREIMLAAGNVMIVDGVVHVTCPEPVYAVSQPSFSRERHKPYASPEFLGGKGSRFAGYAYRADEVDYMAERFGIEDMGEDDIIEIVIPEAVRYDGPSIMMLGAANDLRDWMKARVADRDLDFFKAFMTLRDGMAAETSRREGLPRPSADADEVIALVRDTLDFLGNEECHRHQADLALARLDARALSHDFEGLPTP